MLRLYLQLKFERKLVTHNYLGAKWKFIKIHRKYKMENELQNMKPKNGFRDAKLGGERPSFYRYIE